jgi:diguanylate cyclase (GGDEF)-like protein
MLSALQARLRSWEDRLSIRQQTAVATVLLCLGITAVVALAAAELARRQAERLIGAEMANLSGSMAESLDIVMHARLSEIRTIAELDSLRAMWVQDPPRLRALFDGVQRGIPEFTWIGFADRNGKVLAATKGMLEGVSVAERPWFRQGLEKSTAVDVHDAKLLSQLLGPGADGEPLRFVDVATPVRDANGSIVGVLGAHLDWQWASQLRDALLDKRGAAGTKVTILSNDGIVLLGDRLGTSMFPAARMSALQQENLGAFTDAAGEVPMLTGFAVADGHQTYAGLGWIVLSQRPLELALAAARETAATILGIGLLAALIGLVIALMIADRVARPLQKLTRSASLIGRDSQAHTLPRQRGSREILELTQALRSLLVRVGFAEQRTHEAEARAVQEAQQASDDLAAMRRLAETDHLTGLTNRRPFLEVARHAMDYFKRYQRPFAILMADIDFFKKINDQHGHAAGDAAICKVAEVIKQAIRTTDHAARFGGEEFIVLLREADTAAAQTLAERMRSLLEASVVRFGEREIRMTISIGYALCDPRDRDVEELIERADQALYMAKNSGRNRTFLMLRHSADVSRAA